MTDQKKYPENQDNVDARRRAFLKKSVYAAYATPVITSLLVAKKSAAASTDPPWLQEICRRWPWLQICNR